MPKCLKPILIVPVLFLLLLSACDQGEQPLPTLADLAAISTDDAATAIAATTEAAPTLTPTSVAPTLPPTFTPTDAPSPTPSATATFQTPTPEGYNPDGTIYYIYNGDSIASLSADGSVDDLILIGGPYSDLTASPDGELLTFVAPGPNVGLEVWVSSRDGMYLQQVSCLGFPVVLAPTWSPNGASIAFLASPGIGGLLDIYVVNFLGSESCPERNGQRVLLPLSSGQVDSLAWSLDGMRLFYNDNGVSVLDVASGQTYTLTTPSGFGTDFSLAHHPTDDRLAFLRRSQNRVDGSLFLIDTSVVTERPSADEGLLTAARNVQWSEDGSVVLMETVDGVAVYNVDRGTNMQAVSDLPGSPDAALNPAGNRVAYAIGMIDEDAAEDFDEDEDESEATVPPTISQIFVVGRSGGVPQQLTTHEEGMISDLIWLEG